MELDLLLESRKIVIPENIDFVPEFVRQDAQHALLVLGLLVGPEIVEQLDHFALQLSADLPEVHVLLDGVQLVGELRSVRVHVGYHGSDVADDGSDHHDAQDEVDCVEYVLDICKILDSKFITGNARTYPYP